jgi:hypothetical protein
LTIGRPSKRDPRRLASLGLAIAVTALAPGPAAGQARDPVGGVVGDVRLLTVSLPTTAGWTPTGLTTTSVVPSRGFGGEAGAHVIFGPGRHRRLGLGVTGLLAQGRSTGTAGAATVTTRLTVAAPHVSWNFGHRLGWSYLSGGAGLAQVSSEATGGNADPGGRGTVFHYGGGARWFIAEHVAVSLDLRFWALTPRAATGARPRAPANTRIAFGVGVAVR